MMESTTKSDIVVVTEPKVSKLKWWEYIPLDEYYRLHTACPKCGAHPLQTTTEGFITIVINGENCVERDVKLTNRCNCHICGWIGIYGDLVEVKPVKSIVLHLCSSGVSIEVNPLNIASMDYCRNKPTRIFINGDNSIIEYQVTESVKSIISMILEANNGNGNN